jgi:hypothetical protein
MTRTVVLLTTLTLGAAVLARAEMKRLTGPDATAAFARLKTLAGEWQGDTTMGKARLRYEVIAGGTSLVEHESAEKMAPMMTVYHLDGDRLLLTHYCMAGNQPRMQATGFNPETGEIEFKFIDATNLKPGAGHMREVKMRIGEKQLASEWTFYEKGTPKATETFEYTRVK